MFRFHLDESVRSAIAVGLRSHGVDVTTTVEAGLIGAADEEQLAYALATGRVVVTHDDDFLALARRGAEHAGICYCRQQKYSIGKLLQRLLVVRERCTADEMRSHVEFR
jgi:predicted nuclease of predicted toxin-antitoxin system